MRAVIENHDAWVHNEEVEEALAVGIRGTLARAAGDRARMARIEQQRGRLQALVVRPLRKISSAS